jgi:hypothetical protein
VRAAREQEKSPENGIAMLRMRMARICAEIGGGSSWESVSLVRVVGGMLFIPRRLRSEPTLLARLTLRVSGGGGKERCSYSENLMKDVYETHGHHVSRLRGKLITAFRT